MNLSQLNLAPARKPTARNPVTSRRQSLLRSIEKQIQICEEMEHGATHVVNLHGRKQPTWFWLDETGSYFLAIKYGKTSIELAKGKFSVVCKDITEVKNSLVVIRDAVQRGEFDDNLEKHSKEIRKNFKRS